MLKYLKIFIQELQDFLKRVSIPTLHRQFLLVSDGNDFHPSLSVFNFPLMHDPDPLTSTSHPHKISLDLPIYFSHLQGVSPKNVLASYLILLS